MLEFISIIIEAQGHIMDKKHIFRYFGDFIFFCAAFSLFEIVLRISTPRQFDVAGFLFSILFNCIVAIFFCSLMSLLTGKIHVVINNIFLILVTAIYVSQIIYFNVFGTFYNSESLRGAGQIADFWNGAIILRSIWERTIYILLCRLLSGLYP